MMLTSQGTDSVDDPKEEVNTNTDVIVVVEEYDSEGAKRLVKYLATFFTYRNILELAEQHAESGDFLAGSYFFALNMVLVDKCSYQMISGVVNHLVEQGEFGLVFRKIS